MAISRRYLTWPPGEQTYVGMDFSNCIPPGVTLTAASLSIVTNTNPAHATTDFQQQPCEVASRQAWCFITGGAEGTDYQLRWQVSDSHGHTWNRAATMLCAEQS